MNCVRAWRWRLWNLVYWYSVFGPYSLFVATLFYSYHTLSGLKLKIYVLLKILKLCVQPREKLTSYDIKWAVSESLLNMDPKEEEIGACIRHVLNYRTLRDKFENCIHDELAVLGIVKVEVVDKGTNFYKLRGNFFQFCFWPQN